jgi:hypothetical protein
VSLARQRLARILGVEPRQPQVVDLDAHDERVELEGNEFSGADYSESRERLNSALPVRAEVPRDRPRTCGRGRRAGWEDRSWPPPHR